MKTVCISSISAVGKTPNQLRRTKYNSFLRSRSVSRVQSNTCAQHQVKVSSVSQENETASVFNTWLQDKTSLDNCSAYFSSDKEGFGLLASRDIKAGEGLLKAPEGLSLSYESALASPEVGSYLEGLKPWMAVAVLLLSERSKVQAGGPGASPWGPYIAMLPQNLDLPMFWDDSELLELTGTQVLDSAVEYRAYVESEFLSLKEFLFDIHPQAFPPEVFSQEGLSWAFGILRSRTFEPCTGADVALVPGLDLANLGPTPNAEWVLDRGILSGVLSKQPTGTLTLRASAPIAQGEQIYLNYGEKTNSQLALDFGIVDESDMQGAYLLTMGVPTDDLNFDDKADVAELAGLGESWQFTLLGNQADPSPDLLTYLRLIQLQGTDTFLLEALFRDNAWALISQPVSEENEGAVCDCMVAGCAAALDQYTTTEAQDLHLLTQPDTSPRQRVATVARLCEKRALLSTMVYFEQRKERLPYLEYYQERRLKDLGLLDDNGVSTFDDFFNDGIA